MPQHEIEVTIKGIEFSVVFEWDADSPHEWEPVSAKPVGDDADFLGWLQDSAIAMQAIDAEIERWAAERAGTRYADPMDLARERALEEAV